jgi:hypothetical protein
MDALSFREVARAAGSWGGGTRPSSPATRFGTLVPAVSIPLRSQTTALKQSGAGATDDAPDLSRADPSGADQTTLTTSLRSDALASE